MLVLVALSTALALAVETAVRRLMMPPEFEQAVFVLGLVLLNKSLVFYVTQVEAVRLAQDLENRLRSDLFDHVMRLRFVFHDENRSGKTISHTLRDMEQTKHFFREVWFGYLTVALLLVAVFIAAFWTHWVYGLIVVGTFGTGVGIVMAVGKRIAEIDREVCDEYDHVTTVLQENVAGARVVRAFGQERSEKQKYGGKMDGFSGGWSNLARYWTGRMPWVGGLYYVGLPLVLLAGVIRIHNGLNGGTGAFAFLGAIGVEGGIEEVARVLLFCRKVNYRIRPENEDILAAVNALE